MTAVGRGVDHRHGVGPGIRDIELASRGREREAVGLRADRHVDGGSAHVAVREVRRRGSTTVPLDGVRDVRLAARRAGTPRRSGSSCTRHLREQRPLRSARTSKNVTVSLSGLATARNAPSAVSASGCELVGPTKRVRTPTAAWSDGLGERVPAAATAITATVIHHASRVGTPRPWIVFVDMSSSPVLLAPTPRRRATRASRSRGPGVRARATTMSRARGSPLRCAGSRIPRDPPRREGRS